VPPIKYCIPPRPFSRFHGFLLQKTEVLTSFDGFYYR
jgi:hypothetical protein